MCVCAQSSHQLTVASGWSPTVVLLAGFSLLFELSSEILSEPNM